MRYDQDFVDQMLEVDKESSIPLEETLLKLARYYDREEAWLAACKERTSGGIFRSNGKDLVTLHAEICGEVMREELFLDETSSGFWEKRTPDKWIDYWNKIKDGRVMASMGDLYKSFKIIRKMYQCGTAEQQTQAQRYLDSLRKDFPWEENKGGLVSSTRLFYSEKSLDAKIVHGYRCRRPELTTQTTLEVPVYRGTSVETIVSEEKGLAYLQAFFDTPDDGEAIIQTVEFVSGKYRNSIKGWTANTTTNDTKFTRASHPERAAWLGCSGYFDLDGNSNLSGSGAARGVRFSASARKK